MKDIFDDFEQEPQIDLTPLIDCLFMLIIFFVLSMSFSKPVLDIVLPEAKHAQPDTVRDEILFSVKADGSFWLNEAPSSLDALTAALDAHPAQRLNIYMDQEAPFHHFISVLEVAKQKREGRFVISITPSGGVQ